MINKVNLRQGYHLRIHGYKFLVESFTLHNFHWSCYMYFYIQSNIFIMRFLPSFIFLNHCVVYHVQRLLSKQFHFSRWQTRWWIKNNMPIIWKKWPTTWYSEVNQKYNIFLQRHDTNTYSIMTKHYMTFACTFIIFAETIISVLDMKIWRRFSIYILIH